MKRLFILSSVISIVCFASCTKDITPKGADGDMTQVSFVASQSNDNTKAQYNYNSTSSKYNLAWSNPDALNVFVDSDRYEFANSAGDLNTFSGTVKNWSGNKTVYAVWPAGKVSSVTSDNITVAAPTTATVGADNYSSSLLVAKKADVSSPSGISSMSFKQAMAIIKLQVLGVPSDATVTKVVLSTTSNTLATAATVNVSDGTSTATSSANRLEFTITGGVQSYNTIVNLAVFPTTTAAAYTIEVYSGATKIGSYTTASVTFAKNGVYSVNIDCCNVASANMIMDASYYVNNNIKDLSAKQIQFTQSITFSEGTFTYNKPKCVSNDKMGYVAFFKAGVPDGYLENEHKIYDAIRKSNAYTIEVYCCPTRTAETDWGYIVGATNAGGFVVASYQSQYVFTQHNGTAYIKAGTSYPSCNMKHWAHIIATWNGSKIVYYIDGTKIGESNVASLKDPLDDRAKCITIGCNHGSSGVLLEEFDQYTGYIGQARIWDTSLSDADIAALNTNVPYNYNTDTCEEPK